VSARGKFAFFAWFALAFNIGVILWGAYVRATGSGAGCGDHWPLCNGVVVPQAPQLATIIEFTHRVTSGLALIFVVGLLGFAIRTFPRRHPVRLFATLSFLFTMSEALIGAGLVLLGHVATNQSVYRGYSLTLHLTNTLLLLAVLLLTAWFATNDVPRRGFPQPVKLRLSLGVVAMLLIGMSGVIAALGDTLFAASSLAEGMRQDLSPSAHIFVRLRIWHPVLAALLGCYFVFLGIAAQLSPRTTAIARRLGIAAIALTLVQWSLGVVNLILMAPVWMQLVHLLFADLLWLCLVLFSAELIAPIEQRAVSAPQTSGPVSTVA